MVRAADRLIAEGPAFTVSASGWAAAGARCWCALWLTACTRLCRSMRR
jgi:hypothetical protein